jgi:hypothetical protein
MSVWKSRVDARTLSFPGFPKDHVLFVETRNLDNIQWKPPFRVRAVLVYRQTTTLYEWDILGVCYSPLSLGSLKWEWPVWDTRWTMPTKRFLYPETADPEEVNLPELTHLIAEVWKGTCTRKLAPAVEKILMIVADLNGNEKKGHEQNFSRQPRGWAKKGLCDGW